MPNEGIGTEALRASPLFQGFGEAALQSIVGSSDTAEYGPDEVVFREGETGEHLYIVLEGSIRVSRSTKTGTELPIAFLGPGGCFGEMALLCGGPRAATATSTRRSTLMRIGRASLDLVANAYSESLVSLLENGVRLLGSRLREANGHFWDVARRSTHARLEVAHSRSRLLSLVSHELRTPLTIIRSSAQMLTRSASKGQTLFLEKIVRQTEHLRLLIDDLIALSLLQAGAGLSERSEFDCLELVSDVVCELSVLADRNEVRISTRGSGQSATVTGDRALLRRATRHVLDNAVKFSPRGGQVVVTVGTSENDAARIEITDEGEGIAAEALEHLRQSFVQSQDPLNRDVEGLGIGLALTQEVLTAHGGALTLDSSPGQGSKFTMEWPHFQQDG